MQTRVLVLLLSFLSGPALAEELVVVGTGDGVEMLQAVATGFNSAEPSITVRIPPSIGSGGGIAAVGSGTAKLARVARPLTDAERARQLTYQPVARIPSSFFVHSSAGVSSLTSNQLADIYSGKITNWKDLGGSEQRIRVVRREEADSTLIALRGNMPGWKNLQITERSKIAVSTQEAVETVRLTEGAIGFGPYSKILDTGTVVLKIDGLHPMQVDYPSSAEFAFVYRADTLTPEVSKFLEFAQAKEAGDIIRSFGALPASRER